MLGSVHSAYSFLYHSTERQTLLFSATQTKKIQDLAKLSLKPDVKYVGVDDHSAAATNAGLKQVRYCPYFMDLSKEDQHS